LIVEAFGIFAFIGGCVGFYLASSCVLMGPMVVDCPFAGNSRYLLDRAVLSYFNALGRPDVTGHANKELLERVQKSIVFNNLIRGEMDHGFFGFFYFLAFFGF